MSASSPNIPGIRWGTECVEAVESRLRNLVHSGSCLPLNEVMSYSVLGGGKRLRPLLTICVAEMLGCDASVALPAACASELVHAASLMLDDLPCMDDAALRRSRPSCHMVYGEADTILAAIQLVNLAFGELQGYFAFSPAAACDLQTHLQEAIGGGGLIGGQMADLRSSVDRLSYDVLPDIYARKTSALFIFACVAGGILGSATCTELEAIRSFARHLGLAFQLMDDLRDTAGWDGPADKDRGKDANKCTFMKMTDRISTLDAIRETLRFSDAQLVCFGERSRLLREMICEVFDGYRYLLLEDPSDWNKSTTMQRAGNLDGGGSAL